MILGTDFSAVYKNNLVLYIFTNKVSNEITKIIMAGNRAYIGLVKLLRSSLLTQGTKLKMYRTMIRHVVTYDLKPAY